MNLFEPVCRKFRIPIKNNVGWNDINAEASVLAAAASKAGPGAILPRAPSKSSAGPARVEAQGAAAKGRNLNEAARYGEVFEEMKHLILLR